MALGATLFSYSPRLYSWYALCRAFGTDLTVAGEQRYYQALVGSSVVTDSTVERLRKRLERRGYGRWGRGGKEMPHVFYATRPNPWEPHNLIPELEQCSHLTLFPYGECGHDDLSAGWLARRAEFERDLVDRVRAAHQRHPLDLFLGYVAGWEVSAEAVREIGRMGIVTSIFHLDDKLSFRGRKVGGRWTGPAALAREVDLCLSSAMDSLVKYEAEGGLAMFWPEAANPEHFHPAKLTFEFDVSFIGACYGYRPILVDFLRRNGVAVRAFGPGWPEGPVRSEEMPDIYARSRINLGFGGIGYSTRTQCLKGRDFEVPMCGALYLTSHNPELAWAYSIGSEIVTYKSKEDCLQKIRDLLDDADGAESIRRAARARCLASHTWTSRFCELFSVVREARTI